MVQHGKSDPGDSAERLPALVGRPQAPDAPTASADLASPVLDFEQLRESALGDVAFARELAAVFLQQADEQLSGMQEALGAENAAALRALAHRLKGGALALGALQVGAQARGLEEAAERGDLATAAARLGGIRAACQEVRLLLQQYIGGAEP